MRSEHPGKDKMTREEIGNKLRDLMKAASPKQIDWNSMTEQSDIAALGFDSLSILDLIYDVQQGFKIEFDAEELTGVRTVGDLVTFLQGKIG